MEEFRCCYCSKVSNEFADMIDHSIINHSEETLKLKIASLKDSSGKKQVFTKNFNIIPEQIKKDNKTISPLPDSRTIQISIKPQLSLSPISKIPRLSSTPKKSNIKDFYEQFEQEMESDQIEISACFGELSLEEEENVKTEGVQTEDCIVLQTDMQGSERNLAENIIEQIPDVLNYLKSAGKEQMFLKFNKLLAEKRLPLTNIAFLLFLDVVEWFSIDNTHSMRYTDEVKRFWNIGLKLFKGKFLRYMSGWKNQGQNAKGRTKPENSHINFAVPNRDCLEESYISEKLKNVKPGILDDMIKLVSDNDTEKNKTYKLCVDGKKINVGVKDQKLGDINLWGHEGPPSLSEREARLQNDNDILHQFCNILFKLEQKDIDIFGSSTEAVNYELVTQGKAVVKVLSERVQNLRNVKLTQSRTLEKLKSTCTSDAIRLKYSYALSAIKTFIYQLNICVNMLLRTIDSICQMIAICLEVGGLYQSGNIADMSSQENYFCLTGRDISRMSQIETFINADTTRMKQRSELWHAVRKLAKVTGSSCHKALGLSGLKAMKEHWENIENQPSDETRTRMNYGIQNEINGIATLVTKVLPVYYPDAAYVEEGCSVIRQNGDVFMIVSSDGSVKDFKEENSIPGNTVLAAVEIKCPFPGKLYTTPVFYKIPWYYVTQILSEMYVLGATKLFFLCYSDESSTVFEAEFDPELWNEILEKLAEIYGQCQSNPIKKLPADLQAFKKRVMSYCEQKVNFLAEIPSVKVGRNCNHLNVSSEDCEVGLQNHFNNTTLESDDSQIYASCTVSKMIATSHEMVKGLHEAYSLERRLASEVLVFLVSDLDRIHEWEKQYSVPVGYALKGYSLVSSVMRTMLDEILQTCYNLGLYVPAVSFDGQWSNLAVRSSDGTPLTLLQLQKDVYKEAKKLSRIEIMNIIKNSNIVSAKTCNDVIEQSSCKVTMNEDNQFTGSLDLYRARGCQFLFATSLFVAQMLARKGVLQKKKPVEGTTDGSLLDDIRPDIANSIQDDFLVDFNSTTYNAIPLSVEDIPVDFIITLERLFQQDNNETESNETEAVRVSDDSSISGQEFICDESGENISNGTSSNNNYTEQTEMEENVSFLNLSDMRNILQTLRENKQLKSPKWTYVDIKQLSEKFESVESLMASLSKAELQSCIRTLSEKLKAEKIKFSLSGNKKQLALFLHSLTKGKASILEKRTNRPIKRKMFSLRSLCIKTLNTIPKNILSVIYAEHLFPLRFFEWQKLSPFAAETYIEGITDPVTWYSIPEYVPERFTYQFAFLDCHHLFVNARVKCCSSGIIECGIKKEAWLKVARNSAENGSGLSLALVEDLVDKQSNAFAQKTFSLEVENVMRQNGDIVEANFCKIIREWYVAEDEPGISVMERIKRRLVLRNWLLEGINFNQFPPPGTHIKGIPYVMFEGLLTNTERRIQVIPFVKSGACNPRALGSLEAENFFGEFQELDPKGSGVIRPDDIPKAISTSCELIGARLDPTRNFFMHTSHAKVYPAHQLSCVSDEEEEKNSYSFYMTPSFVSTIYPKNHAFDGPDRAKRKIGKRKCGEISKPAMTSRGARPVRDHHRCDESKVLPEKRLGIYLPEQL